MMFRPVELELTEAIQGCLDLVSWGPFIDVQYVVNSRQKGRGLEATNLVRIFIYMDAFVLSVFLKVRVWLRTRQLRRFHVRHRGSQVTQIHLGRRDSCVVSITISPVDGIHGCRVRWAEVKSGRETGMAASSGSPTVERLRNGENRLFPESSQAQEASE